MNPPQTLSFALRYLWLRLEVKRAFDEKTLGSGFIPIRGRAVSLMTMPPFLHELRIALRMLVRKPGFTTITTLTLALGIGVTSAVFALVQGVLLTPPPYPHADRLVCISSAKGGRRDDGQCLTAEWVAWRNQTKSFEVVAAYWRDFNYLVLRDGSQFLQGLDVTTNYFDLIGIQPLLGRAFLPKEISKTPDPVVILGYHLWQTTFKGDPGILGRAIHISRRKEPLTVVGVMPPGLRLLPSANDGGEPNYDVNAQVDYWVPARLDETQLENARCDVVGRLRPGVALAQAQAELKALANRQARDNGVSETLTIKAEPLISVLNRKGRRLLLPLLGAVAFLFLIACGNVAGLLLARGLQRQQEYSVRRALGAGRTQLFVLTFAEVLLLCVAGGALGAGLAIAIVKILKVIGGAAIPRLDSVTMGWPVAASCLGLAILAAAVAGLLPAIRAARLNSAAGIKNGGRTGSIGRVERRLFAAATVLQVTLTLALLIGAALLVRTVDNLNQVNPGYDTKNVLTMSVTTVDMDQFVEFHVRALERVSALPGVIHAAFAWGVPLTGNKWTGTVTVEGEPDADAFGDNRIVPERAVTPDYFDALRMSMVAGRGFRASDNWENWNSTNKTIAAATDTPFVAVINRAMAKARFGGVNPVGKKLHCNFWPKRPAEIIGVVEDVRSEALAQQADPEIYFSYWQLPAFTKHLIVKTRSDSRSLIAAVLRELRAADPTVAVDHVKTLDEIQRDSIAPQTFAMRLLAGFALVGIYGVLSLSVGSRRREFAIRIAVGAQRRDVFGLVLSEGLKLIAIGLVIGTAIALALGRVLRAFLFGVQPSDPITILVVLFLFTAVALLACFIPARRATRMNPMDALRHE